MKNPTVEKILADYLRANGYDGLFCAVIECCCETGDIADCDAFGTYCRTDRREIWAMGENRMKNPTVEKILEDYLRANGFDGLYNSDIECGCHVDDLAPCDSLGCYCQAGHRFEVIAGVWEIGE